MLRLPFIVNNFCASFTVFGLVYGDKYVYKTIGNWLLQLIQFWRECVSANKHQNGEYLGIRHFQSKQLFNQKLNDGNGISFTCDPSLTRSGLDKEIGIILLVLWGEHLGRGVVKSNNVRKASSFIIDLIMNFEFLTEC